MKRKIIKIIEEKCNGCGICATSCVEGAIQIINGKARLINEIFCDGLGACIGKCPQDAIIIEERKAKPYKEIETLKNIIKYGNDTIIAHLKHLKEHGQEKYLSEALRYLRKNKINIDFQSLNEKHISCPHSTSKEIKRDKINKINGKINSELSQWPIQLHLINPMAGYFQNADVLIAADCCAFSYGDFHRDFIKGKKIVIGCPKLDSNLDLYIDKIKTLIDEAKVKSIDVVTMEVPCCFGLVEITKQAISNSKRKIKFNHHIITIEGKLVNNNNF